MMSLTRYVLVSLCLFLTLGFFFHHSNTHGSYSYKQCYKVNE